MSEISVNHEFDVSDTPDNAWRVLEQVSLERSDPEVAGEWWLPGWESTALEVDRDEGRRLSLRKALPPCEDTIIEITFEHISTGTRIRVTQSGFDQAFIDFVGEDFFRHAQHIFSDMEIFFVTGAIAQRAWLPWAPLGVSIEEASFGLVVTDVAADSWSHRFGLQPGDILLTAHRAPMFERHDLALIERVATSGEELNATWIRGSVTHEAAATV